jgi:cystathionine beta-lyase/cystathionine gamma-synthase
MLYTATSHDVVPLTPAPASRLEMDHVAMSLQQRLRLNRQVLYAESPGSHTFEVQDVPMLSRVAHRNGVKVRSA